MAADKGPESKYAWADEQCPSRGPGLTHTTNASINCLHCGAWVIHRTDRSGLHKDEQDAQGWDVPNPFTHQDENPMPEPEDPPWLQSTELTIHEHDPLALMIHPVSSLWIKHNHIIPERQSVEIKNIMGRHIERFHMIGYVAPLPRRGDLE